MKVITKHMVEIAGGLVIGGLASDAVNTIIKVVKDQVKKIQVKQK